MKVEATSRTLQGTGASRRLRRAGKVPGIVYGGTAQPVNIELDHNALFHAMRKEAFHSSLLDLEVDGKAAGQVLLRDYQMHAFRQIVMHIDFQRVDPNQKLHKKVPLHFTNQDVSPAVKAASAVISHVRTEIDIRCLPKDLPEFIEVDLSNLNAGESIHLRQLVMPAGIELVLHGAEDPTVVTAVVPRGAAADEATEAVAAPAASAAPAAAAPAPAAAAKPAATKK